MGQSGRMGRAGAGRPENPFAGHPRRRMRERIRIRMIFAKSAYRRSTAALALAAGLAIPAAMSVSPASASTLSGAHAPSPGAVQSARPSFTYAVNAWWSPSSYGNTLKIDPSGFARAVGISAAQGVMNNALNIAGWPPYSQSVYNSMFEQLQCHLFVDPV